MGDWTGLLQSNTMLEEEDDDEIEEEETNDDHRERVAWQPKHEATQCFGCGSPFNLVTNRHHHCRACGRVVCESCSKKKSKVRGYSKPQRVCDECEENIRAGGVFDAMKSSLFTLCPCLRWAKKEVRKYQSQQLLSEGAVFLRYTGTVKALHQVKAQATQMMGRMARMMGGSNSNGDDEDSSESLGGHGRIRVRLRPDALSLSLCAVANEEEEEIIYLHEVFRVDAEAPHALALIGREELVLFKGAAVDVKTRDRWVIALGDVIADAQTKPPPPREHRSRGVLSNTARRASREIELQSKKRDAEKRKQELLKSAGGGMKYTALAMSERGNRTLT